MNGDLAYQEEPRMEIIGGKVVMMATPTLDHNRVAGNIHTIFDIYLRGRPCEPFGDNTSVFLDVGEKYVPDMMVVCDPNISKLDGIHGVPDLVVEVLSPSTAQYDRGYKKDAYEKHGVQEYWIVSPRERSVEQYVLEDGRFVLRGVWSQYPAFMLEDMTEEERAAVPTAFRCTLFNDLEIHLEDVFYRVKSGM